MGIDGFALKLAFDSVKLLCGSHLTESYFCSITYAVPRNQSDVSFD